MRRLWLTGVLALACVVVATGSAAAQRGPEKVFAGKIMMSDKAFPTSAKSPAAYIAAVKKQSKTSFSEDKDSKQWKIHFAAFLKVPLPDLEIEVKLLEISGKQQSLVTSFEQFTDQRGQRTIISKLVLDRSQIDPNKELLMIMDYRGKVLASGRFRILGQVEKSTGKVDFSEEEASQ